MKSKLKKEGMFGQVNSLSCSICVFFDKGSSPTHDYVNESLAKLNLSEDETSHYLYLYDHSSKEGKKTEVKHSNLESSGNTSEYYYKVPALKSFEQIQSEPFHCPVSVIKI